MRQSVSIPGNQMERQLGRAEWQAWEDGAHGAQWFPAVPTGADFSTCTSTYPTRRGPPLLVAVKPQARVSAYVFPCVFGSHSGVGSPDLTHQLPACLMPAFPPVARLGTVGSGMVKEAERVSVLADC